MTPEVWMAVDHRGSVERCNGFGTLPRSFLQPCLLLMLHEQPGYGYDLVIRLKALGIDEDSASVYRALRTLEDQHAVSSYWYTVIDRPGPPHVPAHAGGEGQLQAAAEAAAETHLAIERYLCRYALTQSRPPGPDDNAPDAPAPRRRTAAVGPPPFPPSVGRRSLAKA